MSCILSLSSSLGPIPGYTNMLPSTDKWKTHSAMLILWGCQRWLWHNTQLQPLIFSRSWILLENFSMYWFWRITICSHCYPTKFWPYLCLSAVKILSRNFDQMKIHQFTSCWQSLVKAFSTSQMDSYLRWRKKLKKRYSSSDNCTRMNITTDGSAHASSAHIPWFNASGHLVLCSSKNKALTADKQEGRPMFNLDAISSMPWSDLRFSFSGHDFSFWWWFWRSGQTWFLCVTSRWHKNLNKFSLSSVCWKIRAVYDKSVVHEKVHELSNLARIV